MNNWFSNNIEVQVLIAHKNDIKAKVRIHQNDAIDLGAICDLSFIHLSIQISDHNQIDNKSCKTISTFIFLNLRQIK